MHQKHLTFPGSALAVTNIVIVYKSWVSDFRCVHYEQRRNAVLCVRQINCCKLVGRQPLHGYHIKTSFHYSRRTDDRPCRFKVRLVLHQLSIGEANHQLLSLRTPAGTNRSFTLIQRMKLNSARLLQGVHRKGSILRPHGKHIVYDGVP